MASSEVQPQPARRVQEDVLIRRWRLQQFNRLGFDADAARQLADRRPTCRSRESSSGRIARSRRRAPSSSRPGKPALFLRDNQGDMGRAVCVPAHPHRNVFLAAPNGLGASQSIHLAVPVETG